MPQGYGRWLREQRQARGWNVPEMRRRLRVAAQEAGDNLPGNECLGVMIHRWENDRSGISERYVLHYCEVFQIRPDQFGVAAVNWPQADDSDASGLDGGSEGHDMSAVLVQLCGDFLAYGHDRIPASLPLARKRLLTALDQSCDLAARHELCFLLGYMTALVTIGSGCASPNADPATSPLGGQP